MLPNLHMLIKQNSASLPRDFALGTFGDLLVVKLLTKSKSAIPPLFNALELVSQACDQAKLFAKKFSKNFNLDDSDISLPVFPF